MATKATVNVNQILGIGGGPTGTTTSGSPVPSATAVASGDPSAWYYTPEYMAASPQETPGAFNLSGTDVQASQAKPTDNVYVGDAAGGAEPLSNNALIAKIADALHLTAKKGRSLEEQITAKLPASMRENAAGKQAGNDLQPAVSWQTIAQHYGIAATQAPKQPQHMTAGKIAAQLHTMSSTQLAGLQQQLYDAGMYDNAIYTDKSVAETPGHITQWTQGAFGNLLSATNAYNSQNPNSPMTWQQFLTASQNNPNLTGPIGAAKATITSIPQATASQLSSTLQSRFEAVLGRLPTAGELAQFTGEFDATQKASKGVSDTGSTVSGLGAGAAAQTAAAGSPSGAVDLNTGIPMLPGVPTASEAATPFAQSTNQTEYNTHQMSNAYAMFLNSIIGTSAQKALPGYNPNMTNAGASV